ncbi:hypothetical protein POM88_040607 [Heracleum sosnowskyi]|uniref:Rad26/CSB-like winged helix DNA-binding domain-containing protein n=1 Tax=Heracleum sosnowskyi TaxID=360622 RepID=A0AAD8HDH8_9APIA|nr:hypothetical protein POM88_040607 [Heracleum sosnowskyi]
MGNELVGGSRPSEGLSNSEGRKLSFAAGAGTGKSLTSSELLARIRGNQERTVGDGIEQQFSQASNSTRRANIANNSTVKSSNLSGDRIPYKDLPLFKNLLKKIATLEKNPSGSSWVLKQEYQEEQ